MALRLPGSSNWSDWVSQSQTNQSNWLVLSWRPVRQSASTKISQHQSSDGDCWTFNISLYNALSVVSGKVRSSVALYYKSSGEMWLWDCDLSETIRSKLKVVQRSWSAIISNSFHWVQLGDTRCSYRLYIFVEFCCDLEIILCLLKDVPCVKTWDSLRIHR